MPNIGPRGLCKTDLPHVLILSQEKSRRVKQLGAGWSVVSQSVGKGKERGEQGAHKWCRVY